MQKIYYKISDDEAIGLASGTCEAYLVSVGDCEEALIYFPRKLKFKRDESSKWETDNGCGCFSFAWFNGEFWERSENNYLNLSYKGEEKRCLNTKTKFFTTEREKQKLARKLKEAEKILREAGKL